MVESAGTGSAGDAARDDSSNRSADDDDDDGDERCIWGSVVAEPGDTDIDVDTEPKSTANCADELIPFCAHVIVPLFDDVLSIIVLVVRHGTSFSIFTLPSWRTTERGCVLLRRECLIVCVSVCRWLNLGLMDAVELFVVLLNCC